MEVLSLLQKHPEGLSAWQIASMIRRFVHAVRPRITELKQLGVVREIAERYEENTKRHEAVWGLVNEVDGQMELI